MRVQPLMKVMVGQILLVLEKPSSLINKDVCSFFFFFFLSFSIYSSDLYSFDAWSCLMINLFIFSFCNLYNLFLYIHYWMIVVLFSFNFLFIFIFLDDCSILVSAFSDDCRSFIFCNFFSTIFVCLIQLDD